MEKEKATPAKNRVINLIILDESGSMMSIYNAALAGINDTIANIKDNQIKEPEVEQRISIVTFNTQGTKLRLRNASAGEARLFQNRDFQPGGGTPLFDAMGESLIRLEPYVTEDDAVVITIITDGEENSSREYNYAAIRELVDRLTGKGWLFTYIGANQDAERVGRGMGIKMNLSFEATEDGADIAYSKMCSARSKWNARMKASRSQGKTMQEFMNEERDSEINYFDR